MPSWPTISTPASPGDWRRCCSASSSPAADGPSPVWLRAAGIRRGFPAYYFLGSLGRWTEAIAGSLLRLALEQLGVGERLLFALDDTPTPRYGRKVQGAGIHHNPTPGPTSSSCMALTG